MVILGTVYFTLTSPVDYLFLVPEMITQLTNEQIPSYVDKNVVMLMSDIVDWLIPDIPKDISVQIHKEKILMVELFMKEEQGKIHIMEGMATAGGKENSRRSNTDSSTAHPRLGLHINKISSFWCK